MENNVGGEKLDLSDVGMTSLVTLYCRAIESNSDTPILDDPAAVELTRRLDSLLRSANLPLFGELVEGRVDPMLQTYVAMRARHFDACAREFVARNPEGYIVNLGCGFDTRFHRLDDGVIRIYDLDRADVIRIKRRLIPETERYRLVEGSVLDSEWMSSLPAPGVPVLVLAEGLFMYLPFGDIQMLVRRLQERCGTAELVAEVFNRRWLHPLFRWVVDRKLQRALGVGSETRFLSGLRRSREMEDWGPGIEYVDDWSVFDDPEPGLGIVRVLAPLDFVRRSLWVVRYRLQRAPTP